MKFSRAALVSAFALGLVCGGRAIKGQEAPEPALQQAIAGDWRAANAKSRDAARRPAEVLTFWGLTPGAVILEVQPGGGYWTDILAPYARMTGGRYVATAADLANPKLPDGARKARAEFEARLAAKPEVYGKLELVNWGAQSAPLPTNSYDFILTARNVHGWLGAPGMVDKAMREFAAALKPGGTLAVEQHRAGPGPHDEKAATDTGYVSEAFVIERAEKAGLKLVAKSEMNANSKDTKDHPFGVWALPPTRTSVAYGSGQPPNPKFDHSKYDAIGESDRMTLRFVK